MAKFKKTALIGLVEGQFQDEIDKMEERIAQLSELRPHEEEVAEWRAMCETELVGMVGTIKDVPDEELMRFRLPAYPHNVQHEINRHREQVGLRKRQRTNTLRIVQALAADKDNNVTLTVADVRGIGIGAY